MKRLLACLLLLAPSASAQEFSTRALREFHNALTPVSRFGVPRYTTALLPTCGATNIGALAFDTTLGVLKSCNGTIYQTVNVGTATAVTPGTTTVTGCQNRLLYGDNTSLLNCEAAAGYVASTDTATLGNLVVSTALTNTALTATRVPFAGTAGLFVDDSDMTFATDTLTVTNTIATTTAKVTALNLTAATMTAETTGFLKSATHSYTWTNAQVVALGAALTGDITVATLPAKTVVLNAYVVITGQAAGTTTLTVAVGRTSALFIDYIVASDAKAAVNTVYGDASAERGTNLVGYDLPSYTGTTTVTAHFIATGTNLNTVTGSTGRVVLQTALVP